MPVTVRSTNFEQARVWRALARVALSEFIAAVVCVSLFFLVSIFGNIGFNWSNESWVYIPLGIAAVSATLIAAKFLFGYYLVLLVLFLWKIDWFRKRDRLTTGLVHLLVAGLCLVVAFAVSTLLDGSLVDDFLNDSVRIAGLVGIAWLTSFLAVFVPGLSTVVFPRFLHLKWFFS